ncbi:hypothetical protein [Stratiformator vulcanicus]|uniref:Uncharacterized protein n=1 Tax=Stratiformator vulcanicus TaxID=2527980 RepID=A0A517R7R0_9PLAN|nr:hypothetical protein [Stratiformator vulcanicus]QDT39926.1 hypothetical protein Pan189_43380 [Stratiformator vulcanicus]
MSSEINPSGEEPVDLPDDSFEKTASPAKRQKMSNRQVYNTVTDIGTGPNVRLSDNLLQLACILVTMSIGAAIGIVVAPDVFIGILVGGFCGMVLGLLGSGAVIGLYRAWQHGRGKHD